MLFLLLSEKVFFRVLHFSLLHEPLMPKVWIILVTTAFVIILGLVATNVMNQHSSGIPLTAWSSSPAFATAPGNTFHWLHVLPWRGFKIFSQTEADGILWTIFANIGLTNKQYVECGTGDGKESNTRWLREFHNWTGLLLDTGNQDLSIHLYHEHLTNENINPLFRKHKISNEPDFLSIDVDYSTYWLWESLNQTHYRPRVMMIEFNPCFVEDFGMQSVAVVPNYTKQWDGTCYYGASSRAIWNLARKRDYVGVYMDLVNWYFIRRDILNITWEQADQLVPYSSTYHVSEFTMKVLYPNQGCGGKWSHEWITVP